MQQQAHDGCTRQRADQNVVSSKLPLIAADRGSSTGSSRIGSAASASSRGRAEFDDRAAVDIARGRRDRRAERREPPADRARDRETSRRPPRTENPRDVVPELREDRPSPMLTQCRTRLARLVSLLSGTHSTPSDARPNRRS